MALDREAIYVALLARLATIGGLVTGPTRVFKDLDKIEPNEQPAMFLVAGDESAQQQKGLPAKWTLRPTIFIYARTDPETGTAPSSTINPILKAVEASLEATNADGFAAPPKSGTTLGSLCLHCWIVKVDIGEGNEDGQGIAVLHLEILATGAA